MTTATTQIDVRAERVIRVLAPVSLLHSVIYGLMWWFILSGAPDSDFRAGLAWAHGLLWIGMSFVCIAAASRQLLPLRTALAVALLGGIGPFIGTYEFMRLRRNGGATLRST